MDWGSVDCLWIIVFISCLDSPSDGTHSLQRIYWWASDVMHNFSKICSDKKQPVYILYGLNFLCVHFVCTFSANFNFRLFCLIWNAVNSLLVLLKTSSCAYHREDVDLAHVCICFPCITAVCPELIITTEIGLLWGWTHKQQTHSTNTLFHRGLNLLSPYCPWSSVSSIAMDRISLCLACC